MALGPFDYVGKAQSRVCELDQNYRKSRSAMERSAAVIREYLLGEAQVAEVNWLFGEGGSEIAGKSLAVSVPPLVTRP